MLHYPKGYYKITVIDNASQDDTVAFIKANYPLVSIIENKENSGFGKANNKGIENTAAQTKYIALLNQDSLVDAHWLEELVKTMETHPDAGACGATEKDYALYERALQREKHSKEKECIWMGCGSIIFRKKALEEVQREGYFFDPFYFMYAEDIDMTWRLKIAGWKILHNFNAFWFHDGRNRPLTYNNRRLLWAWRNRIYLLFKFGSFGQIQKSLRCYSSMLLWKKSRTNTMQWQKKKEIPPTTKSNRLVYILLKILFVLQLIVSITITMPKALIARTRLRKHYSIKQKEVDGWVEYIDTLFHGNEECE
jgi:GT2 family glycosyltransferase